MVSENILCIYIFSFDVVCRFTISANGQVLLQVGNSLFVQPGTAAQLKN
jgi:hypothetical protein